MKKNLIFIFSVFAFFYSCEKSIIEIPEEDTSDFIVKERSSSANCVLDPNNIEYNVEWTESCQATVTFSLCCEPCINSDNSGFDLSQGCQLYDGNLWVSILWREGADVGLETIQKKYRGLRTLAAGSCLEWKFDPIYPSDDKVCLYAGFVGNNGEDYDIYEGGCNTFERCPY